MKTTLPGSRLFFLDWIRILAFFVLIFYHVGMYYVSDDWHVKSPHAGTAIEPLMLLSSPWRLGLLFMVSGVAASFMLGKDGTGGFVRKRSWRLLLPLAFGMFVVVPPQAYFEVVEKVAYAGSYGEFMRLYVTSYGGFCRGTDCLDMPTWNHLWFVAYLWVYTLVFAAIVQRSGARFAAWSNALAGWLAGWKIIALPTAVLAVVKIVLQPHFETTHGLIDDWYNHAHSFLLFMLGALLARQPRFWAGADAIRWPALGIALACWASMVVAFAWPEAGIERAMLEHIYNLQRVVYALCGWSAIVAACGFGHRHLNSDGAARRYLTEAVFPVYILHQTLIVSMAHMFKPAGLNPVTEAAVLAVLTLCISFGAFELVRRVPVLRPLFGLGARRAADGATARRPLHTLTAR
jgi:glucan biosynthesis protein C